MEARRIGWIGLFALFAACHGSPRDNGLIVGVDGTGGAGFMHGDGGNGPISGGQEVGPLRVHVENANHVELERVSVACPGECVVLRAVVEGGYSPYSYAWDDGSTGAVRTVCPTAATIYSVSATDSGSTSPEFRRDPSTARTTISAEVLGCGAAGASGAGPSGGGSGSASGGGGRSSADGGRTPDGGPPGDPGSTPLVARELCSQRWPILSHVMQARWGTATGTGTLATDADGSVVLVGSFSGSVDFGGGPLQTQGSDDAFVVKFDRDCHHVWSKRFGGPGVTMYAGPLAIDASSNILLDGMMSGTATVNFGTGPVGSPSLTPQASVFLVKLDRNGNAVWAKAFGSGLGGSGQADGIATDGQNVYISGSAGLGINLGGGALSTGLQPSTYFLGKFNASGNHVWSRTLPPGNFTIAAGKDGSVVLASLPGGSMDWGNGNVVQVDAAARVAVTKLDASGSFVWAKAFGGPRPATDTIIPDSSIGISDAGNIFAAGFGTSYNVDAGIVNFTHNEGLVAHVDATGSALWQAERQTVTDEPSLERLFSLWNMSVGPGDSVVLAGGFTGTFDPGNGPMNSAGATDIFLSRFDASGRVHWSGRFGGAGPEQLAGLAVDPSGNAFITGSQSDSDTFFIAKLGL